MTDDNTNIGNWNTEVVAEIEPINTHFNEQCKIIAYNFLQYIIFYVDLMFDLNSLMFTDRHFRYFDKYLNLINM